MPIVTYPHQEFPKMLYHRRLAPSGKVFENAEEVGAAPGDGWVDSPAKFPKPSDLSLDELRDDFHFADERFMLFTSNGASQPGSQIWEEVTAARTRAKDLYDLRLREEELSGEKAKLPLRQGGKPKTFLTAFASYRVGSVLGEGANGTVYAVEDEDGNPWAIKCLKPTAVSGQKLKRFKNEIAFCAKLRHSNLVKVEDWGLAQIGESQLPFFVMPQYPSTLRNLMTAGLEPSEVLPWFLQLLAGIEAAHENRVWHRDLKPENLLCDPSNGTLVVADFGIAHFSESFLQTLIETRPQDRMANFQYAAPEQRRPGAVDHRADIYALGLILNELFTGEVLQGTGHKRIATVSREFAHLDDLVEQMVRQSPNDRPVSVADIRRALIAHGTDEDTALSGEGHKTLGPRMAPPGAIKPSTESVEPSGDSLFAALRLSIFKFADRTFPESAFVDAFRLGQEFQLAEGYVREFLTELHRDGYISIAKWDGTCELNFDQWPGAREFFNHTADGGSIRVRMKPRGKQALENMRNKGS